MAARDTAEQIERLRFYQRGCKRVCILVLEGAIIGGKRDLMVAMATGTGKTFLTVAQIYRLLESKLVRRILFLVDRKALADLISMVKHAAREAEPLLTAEERVAAALAEIRAFHTFTPEQLQWLDLIARHLVENLVENLCIDDADFDSQPIFGDNGLRRARRVFGEQLPQLIERLNYTLAA